MSHITPKDWKEFQQYRDRKPPWIKLHRGLLDNYDFACLPDASRALAPMMWLLASEFDEGVITLPPNQIAFRLRCNVEYFFAAMKPLIDTGFFTTDIEALAERKQGASPEERHKSSNNSSSEESAPAPQASSPNPAPKAETKAPTLDLGEPQKPKTKSGNGRGTRLPEGWKLSQKNTDDARREGLSEVAMAKEATKFRNYWSSKAGAAASKVNWDATWHNWCIRVADDLGLKRSPEIVVPKFEKRSDAEWEKCLRHYAMTNNWLTAWGPKPGDHGCLVPPNLMKDGDDFHEQA